MTPKEKAQELVSKFDKYVDFTNDDFNTCQVAILKNCKQCALIAVDEIINVSVSYAGKDYEFWQEVKQEIEKL